MFTLFLNAYYIHPRNVLNKKISLILPASLLLVASCQHDKAEVPADYSTGRTVLVYMAAQNSLGSGNYQKSDSLEIMNGAAYLPQNGRLLMFIDDNRTPRLYEVTKDAKTPKLMRQWADDICSTDPAVLKDVLSYVRTNFKAADYGLVMWSHADGWLPATDKSYPGYTSEFSSTPTVSSFGIDTGSNKLSSDKGTQMDVSDMAEAIIGSGMHPKFIFFDACLMQNIEVAYELRNATDYVVASPIATPGAGSYYTHDIQSGFFTDDPADIARTYLSDVQSTELQGEYADFGLAISCLRTDRLQALADAVREALPHSVLADGQTIDLAQEGVLNYQAYCANYFYRPHNYDMHQTLRAILPDESFAKVSEALDAAVVYHGATESFWIGPGYWAMQHVPVASDNYRAVSMFIPQNVYKTTASSCAFGNLNDAFRSTSWYKAAGWDTIFKENSTE